MEVKGTFNGELNSWPLVKQCQSDICITTYSKLLFLNEVETRSHSEKDVVVFVCDALTGKMENKIRHMGEGNPSFGCFGLTHVTANQLLSNEGSSSMSTILSKSLSCC